MSVKRNLALNGSATIIHKFVLAGQSLILVPFYLSAWGAAVYGEWLILSAMTTILSFCNLGLGTAATNTFVLRYVQGDLAGAARAMRTGQWLISGAMILGALVSLPLLFTLSYTNVLSKMNVSEMTAIGVIILLGAAALIRFNVYFQYAWFRAARKAHLTIYIETIFLLGKIILFATLLLVGKDMLWIAAVELTVTSVSLAVFFLYGKKLLPNLKPSRQPIDHNDLSIFFKKGIAFLMDPMRQLIHLQGTLFIVRIVIGPEAVALFGTLRTLANSIAQIYISIQASIFPELQNAIGKGMDLIARKLYLIALTGTFLVAGAGIIALALFGPWVYHKWTAAELMPPGTVWPLLLAGILANAAWRPGAYVLRAVNRPEKIAVVGLIAAIAGVAVSALLVTPLGIHGPMLGALLMEVVMAIYIFPCACKQLGQVTKRVPRDVFNLRIEAYHLLRRRFWV